MYDDKKLKKNILVTMVYPRIFKSFNSFKPEFTIVIFIHYKPRIRLVVDEDDLMWSKN